MPTLVFRIQLELLKHDGSCFFPRYFNLQCVLWHVRHDPLFYFYLPYNRSQTHKSSRHLPDCYTVLACWLWDRRHVGYEAWTAIGWSSFAWLSSLNIAGDWYRSSAYRISCSGPCAHVTGENFHRFSEVTSLVWHFLARPERQAICLPFRLCNETVEQSIHLHNADLSLEPGRDMSYFCK